MSPSLPFTQFYELSTENWCLILNSGTRAEFWAGHLGARGGAASVMCMGIYRTIFNGDKLSSYFENYWTVDTEKILK